MRVNFKEWKRTCFLQAIHFSVGSHKKWNVLLATRKSKRVLKIGVHGVLMMAMMIWLFVKIVLKNVIFVVNMLVHVALKVMEHFTTVANARGQCVPGVKIIDVPSAKMKFVTNVSFTMQKGGILQRKKRKKSTIITIVMNVSYPLVNGVIQYPGANLVKQFIALITTVVVVVVVVYLLRPPLLIMINGNIQKTRESRHNTRSTRVTHQKSAEYVATCLLKI